MSHYHPDPDHTPEGYGHHDDPIEDIEHNPFWQRENVVLTSVGIDIGSAGTQILFSRVHLSRQSVDLSTRFLVVGRETLYASPVALTPYASDELIDARRLGEIVDAAYHEARLQPEDIDTGVVILTGEALRRENSERIARVLSEMSGKLVCATAGHHMEATLAAHGSGAVQLSSSRDLRVLNMDIGGGTTKLSVVDRGRIVSTAAIHVGGRLVAIDEHGTIVRLEPAGQEHARRAGYRWSIGDHVDDAALDAVAASMADDLVAALTTESPSSEVLDLYLTDPIGSLEGIDALLCSGGVAEYVYGREARSFGDLGGPLGRALRSRIDAGELPWQLLPDSHGIRSTALGCSEFSVQLSGNTGYISDPEGLLPRRNLKVVRPALDLGDEIDSQALAASIGAHLKAYGVVATDPDLVLALHWTGIPRYRRLQAFARGIAAAFAERIAARVPLYIVLDADLAMSLGTILQREFASGCELLVVDGLELWDFDSIDIGSLRTPSNTVPVTIKSLIFSDVVDGIRRREIVHRLAAVRTPAERATRALR